MSELGRKSAAKRMAEDPDFMRRMSAKGVEARRRIWEAGKRALNGEK